MSRPYPFVFIAFVILLMASCGENKSTAGNSSSETTNGLEVSGVLYNTDGSVLALTMAYLIQITPDETAPRVVIDSVQTDAAGQYSLSAPEGGEYYVYTSTGSKALTSPPLQLATDSLLISQYSDTLRSALIVSGTTDVSYAGTFFVRIKGTPWHIEAPQQGAWSIEGVTPGQYSLELVQYFDLQTSILERRQVNIIEGSEFVVTEPLQDQFIQKEAGTLVLDDFENPDEETYLGRTWWHFDDSDIGRASTIEPEYYTDEGNGNKVARLNISLDSTGGNFVGIGTDLGFRYNNTENTIFNLSNLDSIKFRIQGSALEVSIELIGKNNQGKTILNVPQSINSSWEQRSVSIANPPEGQIDNRSTDWDVIQEQVGWISFNFLSPNGFENAEVQLDDIELVFSEASE